MMIKYPETKIGSAEKHLNIQPTNISIILTNISN